MSSSKVIIPVVVPGFGTVQLRDERGRNLGYISVNRPDVVGATANGTSVMVESTNMIDVYDCSNGRPNLVNSFSKRR